jgi:hypothetical protein
LLRRSREGRRLSPLRRVGPFLFPWELLFQPCVVYLHEGYKAVTPSLVIIVMCASWQLDEPFRS